MARVVNEVYEKVFGRPTGPYEIAGIVDFGQPTLWIAVASMYVQDLTQPVQSYVLERIRAEWPYLGCYILAVTIFSLGILRDHLYNNALSLQPTYAPLEHPAVRAVAVALFAFGSVLVVSSMWVLGVTGTYLGDYFGILMDEMVTGFPFNVVSDPMYVGSTANFVAVALWYAKPAGLLLSVIVWVTYVIALRFEGPFTANIYKEAAERKSTSANTASTPARATASSSARAYGTRSQSKRHVQ